MSSIAAPFGLVPVSHAAGNVTNTQRIGTIASAYGTAIGNGDLVKLVAGNLQKAAAGDACVGILLGVQYTDSNGRRLDSPNWPAGQTGTNIVAYYTDDPLITYLIQGTASIAQSNVGNQADIVATAPNTTTGLSAESLDVSSIVNNANKQLRIVGCTPAPDNAFGDAFTNVLVQISKHQFVAVVNAIA